MNKTIIIILALLLTIGGCTGEKEAVDPAESIIVSKSWRSVGPFELRMSETMFKKVSNVEPEYYHEAVDGETVAEIDIRKFPGVFPATFYRRSDESEYWIRCSFLEGSLFQISYTPPERNAKKLILAFTKKYGAPKVIDDWPNGLTWTRWINKDTVISIAHVRIRDEAHPMMDEPVGTVTVVRSADRILRDKYLKLVKAKPKH